MKTKWINLSTIVLVTIAFSLFVVSCEKDEMKQGRPDHAGIPDHAKIPDYVRIPDQAQRMDALAVTDIDGNVYPIVMIGDQWWMAENLKTTKYNDGTNIPLKEDDADWFDEAGYPHTTSPSCCWYENDYDTYGSVYGALYNWYAIDPGSNDDKNICPADWRIPTDADWTLLADFLMKEFDLHNDGRGEINGVGNALKSCRQDGSPLGGECDTDEHPRWNYHWTHYGTDDFGFSAFPGGLRGVTGDFPPIVGRGGYWWSSTEYAPVHALSQTIVVGRGNMARLISNKNSGFSVRCIKE